MLDAVAKLPQYLVGHIVRKLGTEIDPHPLGTDNADDLLHPLPQHVGCVIKEEVGFIKEKYQFGFLHIANLGQVLKQLRQEPQEKTRIQARL
ncbi:MAG: hypothetical protein BWX80_00382 [Candidatus Hydrogenedentes bacterium ADurb.Bin101]|nr:MAG: hypothetical protein BWX80_00382 [Candidatus Hydrogenedentes bacterium ADurb.Bin101]